MRPSVKWTWTGSHFSSNHNARKALVAALGHYCKVALIVVVMGLVTLSVGDINLWVENCGLKIVGWKLWVENCGLKIVGWKLWVDLWSPRSAWNLLALSWQTHQSTNLDWQSFQWMVSSAGPFPANLPAAQRAMSQSLHLKTEAP
jgi:hypothetical protein